MKIRTSLLLMALGLPTILWADAASRLSVPPGFELSVYASDLGNARGMALSPEGVLYVCQMDGGRVLALPDPDNKGMAGEPKIIIEGLHHPHSLAFYQGY